MLVLRLKSDINLRRAKTLAFGFAGQNLHIRQTQRNHAGLNRRQIRPRINSAANIMSPAAMPLAQSR
jgi:hypothetical protein